LYKFDLELKKLTVLHQITQVEAALQAEVEMILIRDTKTPSGEGNEKNMGKRNKIKRKQK
jgi:hypothetical protein